MGSTSLLDFATCGKQRSFFVRRMKTRQCHCKALPIHWGAALLHKHTRPLAFHLHFCVLSNRPLTTTSHTFLSHQTPLTQTRPPGWPSPLLPPPPHTHTLCCPPGVPQPASRASSLRSSHSSDRRVGTCSARYALCSQASTPGLTFGCSSHTACHHSGVRT